MYKAIAGDDHTELAENVDKEAIEIKVKNPDYLPEPPNLLTIYESPRFETIIFNEIEGDTLKDVERGVGGTNQFWYSGSKIGRNLTAKDINDIIDIIE